MSYDVIVVGAGITGAATAYYLKTSGVDRVLLLEREAPAAGGTGKSAAIVRQHYSNALASRLTRDSIEILKTMPEALGGPSGFEASGWHMLVPASMLDGARENVALQQSLGIRSELLDGKAACAGLPWVNPVDVAAVVHEPDGGFADPVRATETYVSAFERAGGTFRRNARVTALVGSATSVRGVVVSGEAIAAGCVVNAAGPWSKALAASVGLDLPMRVVREQDTVWQARPGRPIPSTSVSNAVDAIYIRPLGERRFIVGRGFPKEYHEVDPESYETRADEEFVSDVYTRLVHRVPGMEGATRIDAYAALYDVTPDWYPFAGPRTGVSGYYDASGGSGHGFKLAPALGRELAQWIVTGKASEEFSQLSHDRLAKGALFTQKYGGNRG